MKRRLSMVTELEKQLYEALKSAGAKLDQYYDQTKGMYGGGRPYHLLRREIDRALAAYDHKAWEQKAAY
jgi:hypothetical protein